MKKIPIDQLRSLVTYDDKTGSVKWISGQRVGREAGCRLSGGYRIIGICGTLILARRVAWALFHGEWPVSQIDHANGDPSDNRLCNLRPSTQVENRQNSRRRNDASSGFKGVVWSKDHNKWRAYIGPRGKVKHLGYFDDPAVAHAAYTASAAEMYGEFARSA